MTTGATLEEAKEAALDALGVDEADAEFETLEEPRQGLFGRRRGEARVRARVRPSAPRPKLERRDRRKRRDSGDGAGAGGSRSGGEGSRRGARGGTATEAGPAAGEPGGTTEGESQTATERPDGAGPKRRRRGRGSSGVGRAGGGAGTGAEGAESGRVAGARNGAGPGERPVDQRAPRSAGRRQATGGDERDEFDEQRAGEAGPEGESGVSQSEATLAEQGEIARTFVVGVLDRFGARAEVSVAIDEDEETVDLQVTGAELGLLIGPKGQTLASLQELTRTVVQRRVTGHTGRILVDVSGYRQRRKEALERFTHQVAADVLASGERRVLEPMSAADRKVVHDTANDIDGLHTASEGEDPNRRVVLLPDSGNGAGPASSDAPEDDAD